MLAFFAAPELSHRSDYFSNDSGTYPNLSAIFIGSAGLRWNFPLSCLDSALCFMALSLQSACGMRRRYQTILHTTFRMVSRIFLGTYIFDVLMDLGPLRIDGVAD